MARSAVDNCLNALYVGFPSSVGSSMRVGNLNSERDVLTADIAFCHVSAPPLQLETKSTAIYYQIWKGNASFFFEKSG